MGEIVMFLGGFSIVLCAFDAFGSDSASGWKQAGLKALVGVALFAVGSLMNVFGV